MEIKIISPNVYVFHFPEASVHFSTILIFFPISQHSSATSPSPYVNILILFYHFSQAYKENLLFGIDFPLPQKLQFLALKQLAFGAKITFSGFDFATYPNIDSWFKPRLGLKKHV